MESSQPKIDNYCSDIKQDKKVLKFIDNNISLEDLDDVLSGKKQYKEINLLAKQTEKDIRKIYFVRWGQGEVIFGFLSQQNFEKWDVQSNPFSVLGTGFKNLEDIEPYFIECVLNFISFENFYQDIKSEISSKEPLKYQIKRVSLYRAHENFKMQTFNLRSYHISANVTDPENWNFEKRQEFFRFPSFFSSLQVDRTFFVISGGIIYKSKSEMEQNPGQAPFYYSDQIFYFTFQGKFQFKLQLAPAKLTPARAGHQMVVCNKKLYFIGGNHGQEYFKDCFCLNSRESQQLEKIPDLNHPRSRPCVASFKNTIYCFGGFGQYNQQNSFYDFFWWEKFTPEEDKQWIEFKVKKPLQNPEKPTAFYPSAGCSFFSHQSNLYILGGCREATEEQQKQTGELATNEQNIFLVEIDPKNKAKAQIKISENTLKTIRTNAKFIANSQSMIIDEKNPTPDTVFLFGGTPQQNIESFRINKNNVTEHFSDNYLKQLHENTQTDYNTSFLKGDFIMFR